MEVLELYNVLVAHPSIFEATGGHCQPWGTGREKDYCSFVSNVEVILHYHTCAPSQYKFKYKLNGLQMD